MGFIGELLRGFLDILAGDNPVLAAVTAAVTGGAIISPLAQRYFSRRKRVLYRVQSDSKIGLDTEEQRVGLTVDQHSGAGHAVPELISMSQLFRRLSFVVIRIRNTGGHVSIGDLGEPMEFTFGGRVIWNARISDPNERDTEEDRQKLVDGLQFFSTDPASPAAARPTTLREVRETLPQRLTRAFRRAPAPAGAQPVVEQEVPDTPPVWHGVRLKPSLALTAREKFKLIVVLSEPATKPAGPITKVVTGPVGHKGVKNERELRRVTWPWITAAFGVLLTGLWIAALVFRPLTSTAGTGVDCAEGDLRIVGSTAFAPTMTSIVEEYSAVCDAQITVSPTGSNDGVREVTRAGPDEASAIAALSDGRSGDAPADLRARPIAVTVYTLIANNAAGVDRLTAEQVRDVYAGRYRNWDELRAGPSVPIRLIGRGGESGSRRTFEQTMLGGASQGELTSDSCVTADRDVPGSPVVRCERGSEDEIVAEVATTPGAIGYVDLASANTATTKRLPVTVLRLDGRYPDVSGAATGYPFWTVEYLYTKGTPEDGTVLASLMAYLRDDTAYAQLVEAGYTPCVTTDGHLYLLCED
ncbi:PstS family phosphate ABC transporter substrate-binding protein [Actinophytocola sediminis]